MTQPLSKAPWKDFMNIINITVKQKKKSFVYRKFINPTKISLVFILWSLKMSLFSPNFSRINQKHFRRARKWKNSESTNLNLSQQLTIALSHNQAHNSKKIWKIFISNSHLEIFSLAAAQKAKEVLWYLWSYSESKLNFYHKKNFFVLFQG